MTPTRSASPRPRPATQHPLRWCVLALLLAVLTQVPARSRPAVDLSPVAEGVEIATITDESLLDSSAPGRLSAKALRLNAARVSLRLALANDGLPALERVLDMATRAGAVAAINAGFFTPRGAPAGVLVLDRRVIGLGRATRGAVALFDSGHRTTLDFARARIRLVPDVVGRTGVLRQWHTPDARDLSTWDDAQGVVGGAGLLLSRGQRVTSFEDEGLAQDFISARHPRSMIGTDASGAIWFVAVDGRRPEHSVGMSLRELQRLADHLGLVDALNLDGGGSTTLVVRDTIVNRPTDLTGPRAVTDAILVLPREAAR